MEPEGIREVGTDGVAGAAELRRRMRAIEVAGVHRRQEELMDIAVTEDGLSRSFAEQVYDLSTEEALPPAYGLALVAAGIGVEELVPPESGDEGSIQQDPPDWVTQGGADPAAIRRERMLRASIRRLRAHLERDGSAERAVDGFLAEPDVGQVTY